MRGSWSPKPLSSIGVAPAFPQSGLGLQPGKGVPSVLKAKATPPQDRDTSDKGFEVNKVLKMSPNNGSCLLELLTPVCESELAGAQVKWACGEVGKEPMRLTQGVPESPASGKLGPCPSSALE